MTTETEALKAALEPDETGFSDADCLALLLDGYARDVRRQRWFATGDALERAARLIRSMSAALRATSQPVGDGGGLWSEDDKRLSVMREIMTEIDDILAAHDPITKPQRKEIDALRQRLGYLVTDQMIAALSTPTPTDAGEDYRRKLRMVISHASGGHLSDEGDADRSLNDICVEISRHHNRVWEAALEKGRKEAAPTTDAVGLREALKPGDRVTLRPIEDDEIVPGGDHVIASIEEEGSGFRVEGHPRVTVFPHRIIHRHPPG